MSKKRSVTKKRVQRGSSRTLALEVLEPRLVLATLVAQWDFDEGTGTAVADSSGNSHNGTLFGPTWVAQGADYAIQFDGRDDYGEFASGAAMGLGGPMTIEAWVKPTAKANGEAVLIGQDLHSYLLSYYNTEISNFYIGSGANNVDGHLTLNGWNHIVATFDGSTMNMVINGKVTQTVSSIFSSFTPIGNLMMGTKNRPDLPQFKGLIDDVRIYSGALTPAEALTNFEAEAVNHDFDPDLFINPQVTPYYYLEDDQPSAVLEVEYIWLDPVFGRLEVTVEDVTAPGVALVERLRTPLIGSGAVDITLPLSELGPGNYVIDVTFIDPTGTNYADQFNFSLPEAQAALPDPAGTTVGALPPDPGPTPYGFTLNAGGGFDVTVNGTDYPFQSRISWPNGNYNVLADTASGEAGLLVTTQALGGNQYEVTATGGFYNLFREIEVFPTHVSVKDKYTNDWNQDLGLLVYNEVPVTPAQIDISLLSGFDRYGRQIEIGVPDYGPTTFFTDSNTGIGIIPLDDVFVVQSIVYVDWQGAAGVGTEEFALAPGDDYTLEWAVYPTGSKDYYDFINAVRTVEGRTAHIEKTPGFITRTPHPPGRREVPSELYIEDRSLDVGIVHSLSEIADDPDLHIEGIEFVDFPMEMALLTQQIADTNAAHPDLEVVLHIAHSLYATDDPDQYLDSRVILPGGQQASWGDGSAFGAAKQAAGWKWWTFYPTPGNSFHTAMLDSVDVLMDQMGFSGGFMDGFMAAYTSQYTYDGTWDGRTAEIHPTTKTIIQKMGSIILLSQPSLIEYAQKIRDKGGVVIANSGVLTRSITNEDYIIFDNEIASGPHMHLAPSVTALSNGPFLSEKYVYFDMLDKLSWGTLYIPFTEGHDFSHPALSARQFPITFRELGSGLVGGDEKIVTMNSDIYGWAADQDLHVVYKYDGRGQETSHDYLTTIGAEARTELIFGTNESAVLEQIPVSVSAASEVNAHVGQYDEDAISFRLHGQGLTNLEVRDGKFEIVAGAAYEVTVGGSTSVVVAQPDATLDIAVTLSGEVEIEIDRAQINLTVNSTPVVEVEVAGTAGTTNFVTQADEDAQVVLTAPARAADSSSTDRFGFVATQGAAGIQVFDAGGAVLQTLSHSGKAVKFDDGGNLFVGDSTVNGGGNYTIWRYAYQGNETWGPAEDYGEVPGRPRALAMDASGVLYIGLDDFWFSNVYTTSNAGDTPVLWGGVNDNSRQIQDMEIGPDGKLWIGRFAGGVQRFPLSGGFVPELTIINDGKAGGFQFGPDQNGDGRPELYGSVDDMIGNIGYYDYESGIQLGTLISDEDLNNYSMTFGPDRNSDGVLDVYMLNFSDRIRIYDGLTGLKITEMAAGLPLISVASMAPKPYHFLQWTVGGVNRPFGQQSITVNAAADVTAVALFATTVPDADFDANSAVDGFDFLAWQRGFGTTPPTAIKSDGDADGDGDVDSVDLGAWQSQYGTIVAPLAAASTTSSLAALTDPTSGSGAPAASSPVAGQVVVASLTDVSAATLPPGFLLSSDAAVTRLSLSEVPGEAVFDRISGGSDDDTLHKTSPAALLDLVFALAENEMQTSLLGAEDGNAIDDEAAADHYDRLSGDRLGEIVFQALGDEEEFFSREI